MSRSICKVLGGFFALCFVLVIGLPLLVAALFNPFGGGSPTTECDVNDRNIVAVAASVQQGDSSQEYFEQFPSGDRAERLKIAQLIVERGVEKNLSENTIEIAVATGIQESGLRNLPYGDRDSLGVFQQRPSQGWGTPAEIANPVYAIDTFYDALTQIPDRDKRSKIEVAIEVQRPDPFYYYRDWKWDTISEEIVDVTDTSTIDESLTDRLGTETSPQTTSETCQEQTVGLVAQGKNISNAVWQSPLDLGSYSMSSGYGWRKNPLGGADDLHNGVDLAAQAGTPIYAVSSGVVLSYETFGGSGGIVTWVNHGDGIVTGYAHQNKRVDNIHIGAKVAAGELIGYVGNTGGSTGNHLHLMVVTDWAAGTTVEPVQFMRERGVNL